MQPIAPRFSTMVAGVAARIARRLSSTPSAPVAMRISSSVPTIRSQSASTVRNSAETRSDFT